MTTICIRCGEKVDKAKLKKSKICEECYEKRSRKTKKDVKAG